VYMVRDRDSIHLAVMFVLRNHFPNLPLHSPLCPCTEHRRLQPYLDSCPVRNGGVSFRLSASNDGKKSDGSIAWSIKPMPSGATIIQVYSKVSPWLLPS